MSKPCKRCNKRHLCSKKKSKPRSTKNEETAKIREAVFHRACNNCELCMWANATELHHLEGGSGRLALQRVSNCMATCRDCHHFFHNAPETYREMVLSWCGTFDYPVPRRFRGPPKRIVGDAASAAKEAVSSVHEPIARKAAP